MSERLYFDVELVEREIVNTELIERELINIDLNVIDLIADINMGSLKDVNVTNPLERNVLIYNNITGLWENKFLSELLSYYFINNEVPTKINDKRFQTANVVLSGTLAVYFNGIKEKNITIIDSSTFELPIDSIVDDVIEVEYIRI